MRYRDFNRSFVLLLLVVAAVCGGFATRSLSAKNEAAVASASPSPTPRTREELPQDSDEIIKVETNLTNIFFTAADKHKRFVSNLKPEDIRVFEDGQQQRSEEHTSELQSPCNLVCRLLLEKKKQETRAHLEQTATLYT